MTGLSVLCYIPECNALGRAVSRPPYVSQSAVFRKGIVHMMLGSWTRVETEARRLSGVDLRTVAQRADLESFIWRAPHVEADVAKQPIDARRHIRPAGVRAANADLAGHIGRLFAGGIVNASENRPALHWALRGGGEGLPAVADMRKQQAGATAFAKSALAGGLGFQMKTILHIGIGGSDLGPRLVWDALRGYGASGPEIRFCANIDPEDFLEATTGIDPEQLWCLWFQNPSRRRRRPPTPGWRETGW